MRCLCISLYLLLLPTPLSLHSLSLSATPLSLHLSPLLSPCTSSRSFPPPPLSLLASSTRFFLHVCEGPRRYSVLLMGFRKDMLDTRGPVWTAIQQRLGQLFFAVVGHVGAALQVRVLPFLRLHLRFLSATVSPAASLVFAYSVSLSGASCTAHRLFAFLARLLSRFFFVLAQ